MKSASTIRRDFLEYFANKHGHEIVDSASVIPHDDPTLLFTNAGMNQFKDVFLGQGTRTYSRAVDTQKCIRAGGKHNDLEDVGKDTYHHTFFEMLGNWSFGDYFKEEAIAWAWDLLTNVWGLETNRLYVTVFQGDEADGLEPDTEAEEIWKKYVEPSHVMRFDKKDNFWEMGATGPCGPCSEIHYDATEDMTGRELVNADDPRVIEIWNLVFIQFNRGSDGTLVPLPDKHVDTGMGLERVVRVIQRTQSNYDTDLFGPIFLAIESHTGAHTYTGHLDDPVDIAYRVIADHIRCLTVAIADGGEPSNEGRGYVLRRILRRAVRHANQTLGVKGLMLHQLVASAVESLSDAFPELRDKRDRITKIVKREEEAFLKTLDRGIALFIDAVSSNSGSNQISAEDIFQLHDTYGFPIDLTRVMAEERGMTVDEEGFEKLMEEARERSRKKVDAEESITMPPEALAKLRHANAQATDDSHKYKYTAMSSEIVAIWNGTDFDTVVRPGRSCAIILKRTNHYAEQGGQVGDTGYIHTETSHVPEAVGDMLSSPSAAGSVFKVNDTQKIGEFILHLGQVKSGAIRVDDKVMVDVDDKHRLPVMSNHTATHLLNHALRDVLGDGVQQKGSLVAPDRLRFDFSSDRAMTAHEVEAVEKKVNASIHNKLVVNAQDVSLDTAMKFNGVRAVFGEKYPDPVRVVSIGPEIDKLITDPENNKWRDYSIEFCGGTHLTDSSEAKRIAIISEQALAAGVRRIVAVTGPAALAADGAAKELEARCFRAKNMKGDELVEEVNDIRKQIDELTLSMVMRNKVQKEVDGLLKRVKELQKASQSSMRDSVVDQARTLAESTDGNIIVDSLLGADTDSLMVAMDVFRSKRPEAASMLFGANEIESKVSIVAQVPKELIEKGLKAGDWVREVATICGGGGGGGPDKAQAGGKSPEKVEEAIRHAKAFAEEKLK